MKNSSQALPGTLSALLLALIVMGSMMLSMVESDLSLAIASGAASPLVGAARSGLGISELSKLRARSTPFLPQAMSSQTGLVEAPPDEPLCTTPVGWVLYVIQTDDTLADLADKFGVQPQTLAQNNCMDISLSRLIADTTLLVPNELPTLTATHPPNKTEPHCGPPSGWVTYIVRSGDTLYRLSQLVGVSIAQLQQANCMGSSIYLRAGQRLYVPQLPPRPTATRTPTPAQTLTASVLATGTQPQASFTPSSIPSSTPTSTPQPPAPSNTPVPPSPTDTPTNTLPPTDTPQPTSTPQPTDTPQPTSTPTVPPPPPPPGALFFVLLVIFLKFIMT